MFYHKSSGDYHNNDLRVEIYEKGFFEPVKVIKDEAASMFLYAFDGIKDHNSKSLLDLYWLAIDDFIVFNEEF